MELVTLTNYGEFDILLKKMVQGLKQKMVSRVGKVFNLTKIITIINLSSKYKLS